MEGASGTEQESILPLGDFNPDMISGILRDWRQSPIGAEQNPEGWNFYHTDPNRVLILRVDLKREYIEFGGGILEGSGALKDVTGLVYSKRDDGAKIKFVTNGSGFFEINDDTSHNNGIIFTMEGGRYIRVVPSTN